MGTVTTFETSTGTRWRIAGTSLWRAEGDEAPDEVYEAVPNAVSTDGVCSVQVRPGGRITFLAGGVPTLTGRITAVLHVASVASAVA